MLEDVARAWRAAGLDVAACLQRATTVTNEFIYTHGDGGNLCDRLSPRVISDRTLPVRLRDLSEVLNPQPEAIRVFRMLLTWIESTDLASKRGGERPEFKTLEGEPVFPGEDNKWWLTDVQQRKQPEEVHLADEDGPVSECDDQKDETEDEDPTSEEEFNDTNTLAPAYASARPNWAPQSHERRGPV